MVALRTTILLVCLLLHLLPCISGDAAFNLTLPHQHQDPDSVAQDVKRIIDHSLSRRRLQSSLPPHQSEQTASCGTGNPIDDCWRCDPDWSANRQKLADCVIGFGQGTLGGKGGRIYVVTDSSDDDPANPTPGTLRHAVIQLEPLWIVFLADMVIKLEQKLAFNSYKTIDGRGAKVQITGNGCLTLRNVSHVIIHNIRIRDCKPSVNTTIPSSPTQVGQADGDGIAISSSQKIWIDHCTLSHCTAALIDAIMGSTAITISSNHFSRHDNYVMLLGHDNRYLEDEGMQVTIAFNRFAQGLVQGMPRCRLGYIHVVNNDFTSWAMYAIGGSANPTINSQGNRYAAPPDPNAKEVTKRVDADLKEWASWNWRTDGDLMMNGAFFVASGIGASVRYAKATSTDPHPASCIDQLTMNSGVFSDSRGGEARQILAVVGAAVQTMMVGQVAVRATGL